VSQARPSVRTTLDVYVHLIPDQATEDKSRLELVDYGERTRVVQRHSPLRSIVLQELPPSRARRVDQIAPRVRRARRDDVGTREHQEVDNTHQPTDSAQV
jgi:hypothetical protein